MTHDPVRRPIEDHVLDGNAVGGLLAVAFGREMTDSRGRCGHCGAENQLGGLRAYVRAPGTVLRCPVCDGVIVRIVETDRGILVDVQGAAWLRVGDGPSDR